MILYCVYTSPWTTLLHCSQWLRYDKGSLLSVTALMGCLETIFYTGITAIPTGPGVANVGPAINVVGYLVIGRANLVNQVNKAADGRSAVLTELYHVMAAHFCNGVIQGMMVFTRNG